MNIEQAKAIPIEQFLAKLGYEPARSQRGQLWYLSPLRQEKTASFKVNPDLNLWFDFGSGEGGTIVDLAMAFGTNASIPAALGMIEATMQGAIPNAEPRPIASRPSPQANIEPTDVGPLRNLGLKRYLSQRGIPLRIAAREVSEVHYATLGRDFVAIGFSSNRRGYEVRNRSFKGSLGAKSISIRSGEDSKTAIVFEGFFDYLTYLTLWGKPTGQVLVLNSVSFREQAVEQLRKEQVARIELFRDNDSAGEALLAYFREQLPAVEIVDQAAAIYPESKDLNEWHLVNRRTAYSRAV